MQLTLVAFKFSNYSKSNNAPSDHQAISKITGYKKFKIIIIHFYRHSIFLADDVG